MLKNVPDGLALVSFKGLASSLITGIVMEFIFVVSCLSRLEIHKF